MNEQTLLEILMVKYQNAIVKNKAYTQWQKDNPSKYYWMYEGEKVPKAEIQRLGIMIRQTMIDYEKHL